MATYQVTLAKDFPYAARRRAGITVDAAGFKGELSDEQVEAIKADPFLTIKDTPGATRASVAKEAEVVQKPIAKAKK